MKTLFVIIMALAIAFGCQQKNLQNKKFYVFGKYINEEDTLEKYNYVIFDKKFDHYNQYLFTLKSSEEFNAGDTLVIVNKRTLDKIMAPQPLFLFPKTK